MNQTTLIQGEPWMTSEERALNRDFVQSTTEHLASHGVPATPLLMIRINDVIATWLLARRLETALAPEPGEPAPCPTPAQAGAIGKCRDRLRRAMKDLEACCPRDAAPAEPGILEHMQQTTQPIAGTDPANQSETQCTAPTPQHPSDSPTQPSHESGPAEYTHALPTTKNKAVTETDTATPVPRQPKANLPQASPPAAQPPRQRNPTKKRRKKRGCPKRSRAS